MLDFDLILVFIVLLFILISLYREILGPAFTFMVGVIFLGVFGVLTPAEILKGFANEQVAVVILLLMIGDLIRKTGAVQIIFDRYFKSAKSYKGFLSRMILLLSGFSSFLKVSHSTFLCSYSRRLCNADRYIYKPYCGWIGCGTNHCTGFETIEYI